MVFLSTSIVKGGNIQNLEITIQKNRKACIHCLPSSFGRLLKTICLWNNITPEEKFLLQKKQYRFINLKNELEAVMLDL